jgi:hypothetical protein
LYEQAIAKWVGKISYCDNINVHVALQSAYSSVKPNLDVLGVATLMLV